MPTKPKVDKKNDSVIQLVFSEDDIDECIKLDPKDNPHKEKAERVSARQNLASKQESDEFSITDGFNLPDKKGPKGKKQAKKQEASQK